MSAIEDTSPHALRMKAWQLANDRCAHVMQETLRDIGDNPVAQAWLRNCTDRMREGYMWFEAASQLAGTRLIQQVNQ